MSSSTRKSEENENYPVKIARTEEQDTTLCFVVATLKEYRWYTFNANDVTGDEPRHLSTSSLLCQCPFADPPYGFACVHLNSKLYLIGGIDHHQGSPCIPSSRVHIFDMKKRKWEIGNLMLGGKAQPMVVDVDGMIYVFGNSLPLLSADPWAEVYNPASNNWDGLPYPPNTTYSECVLHEEEKKVLVNSNEGDFWFFDIESKSWTVLETDFPTDVNFCGRPVIVDNHLFFFDISQRTLYAVDLAAKGGAAELISVTGLQQYTDSMYVHDLSFSWQTFLFNIGAGKMCLVWSFHSVNGHDFRRIVHIRCLKFQVNKSFAGYSAVVHGCNSYFIEDAVDCSDCFTIKHNTISNKDPTIDTESMDTGDVPRFLPGFQQTVQTTNADAQVTRNARRVYVEGFSPTLVTQPLEKEIEKFFNEVIAYPALAAPVVSVYFNEDRMFAIVEMRTEEEARDALKIDHLFQGSRLKIRRPTDYIFWAAPKPSICYT